LGSRNGTNVNGNPITAQPLNDGDVISIGRINMKVVLPMASTAEREQLSAADLVDVGPGDSGAPSYISAGPNYEAGLEKLVESLPDNTFGEGDIELIGARGTTMHHASNAERGKGRRETVELFRLLLLACFRSHTSDIHVEPRAEAHQVRLRIDGTMVDVMRLPNQMGIKLTALVKVLSDIDIQHKNAIQEGHFTTIVPSPKSRDRKRRVDYRVSFAPALHGQKLVIRILDPSIAPARIADLQLPAWMYEKLGNAIGQDSGMVLVAGPTGSGKTTSLYALIRSLHATKRNVVTIEDPVEIQIENVTQIPVDESREKSFAQLLRSVLRQDPDVLLVGEVRDSETARIAMQAAITGHLIFSTVHTKDTIGSIFRLLDLGIEPYLVAQALHMVLAQRLARRLCPHCKKQVNLTPDQRQALGPAGEGVAKVCVPRGCAKCLGTGYAGRQAFFELLAVNDALRDVIMKNPNMQDINAALTGTKFVKLSDAGYRLVIDGVCSFDEIDRIVGRER
jgi:type II secretory ATPase GspE/PulE/Tfp pilus assembly ATPase PilB-like protein